MIGTHDTFTYLKAKYSIFEPFSFIWRTQDKNIVEQCKSGVRYFDIRVRKKEDLWQLCHGLVDLDYPISTLYHYLDIVNKCKAKCRIILERGNQDDILDFQFLIGQLSCLKEYEDTLMFACIKHNWEVILDKGNNYADYSYKFWNGKDLKSKLKNLLFNSIKKNAKKNPKITRARIRSKIIHFMDYV